MVAIRFAVLAFPLLALLASACSVARETEGGSDSCTACHGDATRASGQAAPDDVPHDTHLAGGATCDSCHVVPSSLDHVDGGPAQVTLGGAAAKNGATPTYDVDAQTCTNTYCHGGSVTFVPSGTPTPPWGATGPTCTSCHDYPPASHDAGATECAECHSGTVQADDVTIVVGGRHLDGSTGGHPPEFAGASHGPEAISFLSGQLGASACTSCHGADFAGGDVRISCNGCHASSAGVADWQANCTFCHGTRAEPYTVAANPEPLLAAPPEGVAGATDPTDPSVGAHATHLNGETVSDGVACADCHSVPQDLGHLDGDAAVVTRIPGTATARGTFAAGTCSSTWCHGNFPNGRAGNSPSWIATSGQDGCATCHSPQWAVAGGATTGSHGDHRPSNCTGCHADGRPDCSLCHGGSYSYKSTPATVDRALHVNGAVDVVTAPLVNWNGSGSCSPGCHTTHGVSNPRSW